MSTSPDARAEGLLEWAKTDPEFEAALRAAYRGRHDVLDALWWSAHPFTTSPRGVADPATGLRELQRTVFSRAAADSPLVEVPDPETGATLKLRESEHRLRQEQLLLSEDARHLTDAMGAVSARSAAWPTPPEQETPTVDAAEDETTTVSVAPRPKLLLPALAGMGILTIILLLPTLSELIAGADGGPSPSLTTAPRITTEIVTLGATGNVTAPLGILDRPQEEADRPPAAFPISIPIENFRALPDLVAHVRLYLARGDDADSVCLVVVQLDNLGMSGCTPASDFVDHGLHLSGGRYAIDDYTTILTESYSLLPSGEFRYDATARVRERDAP